MWIPGMVWWPSGSLARFFAVGRDGERKVRRSAEGTPAWDWKRNESVTQEMEPCETWLWPKSGMRECKKKRKWRRGLSSLLTVSDSFFGQSYNSVHASWPTNRQIRNVFCRSPMQVLTPEVFFGPELDESPVKRSLFLLGRRKRGRNRVTLNSIFYSWVDYLSFVMNILKCSHWYLYCTSNQGQQFNHVGFPLTSIQSVQFPLFFSPQNVNIKLMYAQNWPL